MKSLIIIALLLAAAVGLMAHPASSVVLSYDAKTQLLSVNFEHSVKNPADHFIENIMIKIDGKEMINQMFTAQEKATSGNAVYRLTGLKSGTVIEATGTCNKMGKKTGKLTIK
ncbi:MAG: hypothetical protein RBS43_00965 [Candidatus Cloacimonas sp.]|jgi:hypothetical protein|nr:hypothetical protein [Candidatus Cloacimonas sp.]